MLTGYCCEFLKTRTASIAFVAVQMTDYEAEWLRNISLLPLTKSDSTPCRSLPKNETLAVGQQFS